MRDSGEGILHRLSQKNLSLTVQACPGIKFIETSGHQNTFWTEGEHCLGIQNILGCTRGCTGLIMECLEKELKEVERSWWFREEDVLENEGIKMASYTWIVFWWVPLSGYVLHLISTVCPIFSWNSFLTLFMSDGLIVLCVQGMGWSPRCMWMYAKMRWEMHLVSW